MDNHWGNLTFLPEIKHSLAVIKPDVTTTQTDYLLLIAPQIAHDARVGSERMYVYVIDKVQRYRKLCFTLHYVTFI